MGLDKVLRKSLRTTRILLMAFLGGVLVCIVLLAVLVYFDFPSVHSWLERVLTPIAIALGFCGLACFVLGIYVPRYMIRRSRSPGDLFRAIVIRCACFLSPAILGFVLGVLGARWHITVPFFIVSAGGLILTFPTEKRLKKMME